MPTRSEVQAQLTGPGGMFEITTAEIDGVTMKVYKDRLGSLRDVAAMGQSRGEAEEYIVYGERRYSFARFVALANSVSNTLMNWHGVGHGERVAILSANNPEWCLAFWGTVDIGAIVVGLNGWWKADEIVYGLQDSGAKVLVADRARFQRIADRLDDLPSLEMVFLVDPDPADLGNDKRVHAFDELLVEPTDTLPTTLIEEGDPAVILYTSGTTGRAKGAISTHRSMVATLQNTFFNAVVGGMIDTGPGGVPNLQSGQNASLLTAPLFHVSACHTGMVIGMLGGVKQVMLVGKFDPVVAMELIETEKIAIWATVPTMVWRVVEHPDRHKYDLSSVSTVAYGGSPSGSELQRCVRETFPKVRSLSNAYGLTETSSVAVVNTGQDFLDRPESVGLPVPVVDLTVVDLTGEEVPAGATGEVWVKGPIVMPGYWGKPEATADSITDGWLHTGDVGYLDADGFLYITDRAKDMIIRGGENIYCAEIENRLMEHPGILDAAVIGVPHPTMGEEVKAIIEVEPGATVTDAEVKAWVAETLANFKVPEYIEVTSTKLPRNASGKLLKEVLRGRADVTLTETM